MSERDRAASPLGVRADGAARSGTGASRIERGGIWQCKVGEVNGASVPDGGDAPMRDAVARAFKRVTGEDDVFIFSGWSAELTEAERAAVEDRLPVYELTEYARAEELLSLRAENVRLRDALDEIVDDLSVPSRPATWAAHALQVAQTALDPSSPASGPASERLGPEADNHA